MKVTNIENGPRGINTESGTVLVEAGQTVDVEVSTAELKVAKATGWFEFSGAKAAKEETKTPDGTGGAEPKTAAEVLELVSGNFMTFKAEAKKLLGDKTPGTKEEIIAALEDLATQP